MSLSQADLSKAQRSLLAKQLQKAHTKIVKPQAIGRRPEGEPMALSFAQRRLWFLDQWQPDSPAYNISIALRLVGRLDVSALRRAFNETMRRHQVLQMIYVTVDGEPVQVPHSEPSLALEVADLSTLPAGEREAEVQRKVAEKARHPFNLAHDLLIRTTLWRLDEAEHVLLLTIHHIATDGWSMGVLVKELAALYEAFCDGKPSPLPELPIHYADFAYWQRNWLQGEVLDKQMAHWKQQLAGSPAVLELPADRPRPSVQTFNGASHRFRLSPSLTQAIKTLSRQEGVTPFMTLLAAFQTLLHRYSGQDDIVVGSPIANRNRSEIEGLIGFFVNTLALRADLSGNPSVRELLQQVRQVTLEAYAHQDLPFEKLVGELQPERSLNHSPLFQVMFNYHNTPQSALELPCLTIEYLEASSGTAKFDLNLSVIESSGEISGTVAYNTDLFEMDTIRRMVDHFQALLAGMAATKEGPERRLAELPLLTPAERQQLLVEWCDTQATYPPVQCVHQLFEEQAARTPNAVAVVFEDQQYTYRQLNQRANQVAHHLQSLGAGPDVRVGLLMERSLDILVGLIGILKAGGAYVPLDPIYPQERIRFMLQDVQAPVLVTQSALAADLPDLGQVRVLCLDGDWDTIAQHSTANPPIRIVPSNLIYALFTSGSTGRPKGVAVEHRNYLNYYHGVMPRLGLSPGLSFAMLSTFSTDLGTIQFWAPLTTGGTVHVISYERATDPQALADYFCRHTIDVLKLVPSHFEALQGAPGSEAIVPRKLVIFTGEASHWETVAQVKALNPACMVQDHYGVTETTCATLTYVVPDEMPAQRAATLPLGQLLGNARVYTLDAQMEPTPIGIPGELFIGGLGVTRGYIGRPQLTAERFVPDPFAPPTSPPHAGGIEGGGGARLYRTGDLATYRADGSLKLLGRIDHQVKIRGYRVETGEIEALLCEHPSVQDALVMAREDTPGDKRLVAYVVAHPGQDGNFAAAPLRDGLREQLPDYMLPTAFVTLERIPLNSNGKVDRFALPAPDASAARLDSEAEFVAPRGALEAQVAAAWSEVLGIEEISIDDNFFDLGGESFKAIRVVRKISESVSVMDLFKCPTIRELAAHLAQDQPKYRGLLYELTKPVPTDKKLLSLVCIPYGGANAIMYQPLANALPENCSLYAVQIPGHDYAYQDKALESLEQVAQRCVEEIKRDVTGPIALYGHCVGGALATEIARLLEADNVEVVGLFLAGTFPSPRLPGKFFELLAKIFRSDRWASDRTLHDFLRALGGFTDVIDPQERAFVLHSLRHDVREAEDYYTAAYATREDEKLKVPILCIIGQGDQATAFYEERFKEWEFFSDAVDLAVIPQAGHYFLKHQADQVARIVTGQQAVWQGQATQLPGFTPDESHVFPNGRAAGAGYLKDAKVDRRAGQAVVSQQRPSLSIFFLVALSQFVSLIGTGLTSFALGVWVFQRTGAVSDLAFIAVFTQLPGILLLPIAGAVIDRWDRRRVMILSDVAAACGTLLVALLFWTGSLQIWHICVTASIGSIANAFQRPAYMVSIAQLVPKQYLGHANGIAQFANAAGNLLAPLLGGVLVVMVDLHGVVLIDFATFLFAITTLLLVRFPDTMFRRLEEPFLQEIVRGWQYIIKRHSLVAMIVFFAVTNFLLSMVILLVTPLVLSLGSPTVLGTVAAAIGIGTLVGGLVMSLWGGTKRRAEGMVGFVILFGLSAFIMGVGPSPIYPAVGLLGIGFSFAIINAHWLALIQTKVGLELQGRVLTTNRMLALSTTPLGSIVAGPLADKVFEPLMASDGPLAGSIGRLIGVGPGRGMGLILMLAGLIALVWAVLGYRYRPLRFMEDELPDAIPDAIIVTDRDALQEQADHRLMAETV